MTAKGKKTIRSKKMKTTEGKKPNSVARKKSVHSTRRKNATSIMSLLQQMTRTASLRSSALAYAALKWVEISSNKILKRPSK